VESMDKAVDCLVGWRSFVQLFASDKIIWTDNHVVNHNNSPSHYDDFPIPTSFYYHGAGYNGTDDRSIVYIRSLGLE